MLSTSTTTDIKGLFNTIAAKYDFANALMSAGCISLWYRRLVHTILSTQNPHTFLDLCCGTGAVTKRLVNEMRTRKLPMPSIDCIDFSEEMLEQARLRLETEHISPHFINADATCLPLADSLYDTVTIAYGIRNIAEKEKALREVFRILKPHGKLYILELTTPSSLPVYLFHTAYLRTLVPLIGGLLTKHIRPYVYLDHSIEQFSLPDLVSILQDIGFSCHKPISLSFGIATLIQAEKI